MCPTNDDYDDDDELLFLAEDVDIEETKLIGCWNVLLVDDDEEVHSVTRLALSDLVVNDKNLNFFHAYSGKEALEMIAELGSSIAIILLDVVMETDDAGLQVAHKMRTELMLEEPRIILRTGQPGYAPEESVIKDYDINDYKTKTELTRSKLVTSIIASLRAYQQILALNQSRVGLERIIVSAANLLEEHSVRAFCEGVVTQISCLLNLQAGGVVCARAGSVIDKNDDGLYILGAAGEFAPYINEKLECVNNDTVVDFVTQCLQKKHHIFEENFSVLYLNSSGYEAATYVQTTGPISSDNRRLLEIFLSSLSVGYENVNLFHQLRTAAFKDKLTKLSNRSEFINMLDELGEGRKNNDDMVVALIDIKHFSDINDGLGQDAGNNTLLAIAQRLEANFTDEVSIGRIGSDIFGLIGPNSVINPETVQDLFVRPFKAGDHTLPLNGNFGFYRLDGIQQSGINILKQSNIALNRAKKNLKTNFEYYVPEMEEQTTRRLEMIRKLRTDFNERKLQLWYQPQVDLATENVIGMEALLRWPTADGRFVSPVVFIPLAEYSGLIIEIGAWVLEEACEKLKELSGLGFADLRMAVNISMPQFRDPNFIDSVKRVISANGLEPGNIELEITESIAMDEPKIVVEALHELKSFGIQVAIDDFGTGFSSMSYLQQLPLDRLKVDRSFVDEISPGKSAFIAETIVTLGSKLGLSTIAEGVENREQATYMLNLGCDEAQGYFFAKPMPYEQLLTFLQKPK